MRYNAVGCFVTLTLSLLAVPLMVTAQPRSTVPRIGILAPGTITQVANTFWEPFLQGLRDLGYVEGQNLAVEYRFAAGQNERLPALAAELARLPVDVLVTAGAGAPAAKQATATTPIVFTVFADPVGEGLVASLARPGGNVTGLSIMVQDLAAKRLELLTEVVPGLRHIALLWHLDRSGLAKQIQEIHAAAAQGGIQLEVLEVRSPQEFDRTFLTMREKGIGAAIIHDQAMFHDERTRLITLAAQHQIPAMYGHRGYVDAGGLLSYGPNFTALFRRAATFVDKILKGAKPGDLPVEQPTTFALVINLKTAQTLGLTIPPTLLFQADEVIR
jgi:putative tryptophan/tyrosine transport system substrate-binding protein